MSNENQSDPYSHQLALKHDSTFWKSKSGLAGHFREVNQDFNYRINLSLLQDRGTSLPSPRHKCRAFPSLHILSHYYSAPPSFFFLLPSCFFPVLSSSSSAPLPIFHPILSLPYPTLHLYVPSPSSFRPHWTSVCLLYLCSDIPTNHTQKPEKALSVFFLEDYNQFFKWQERMVLHNINGACTYRELLRVLTASGISISSAVFHPLLNSCTAARAGVTHKPWFCTL